MVEARGLQGLIFDSNLMQGYDGKISDLATVEQVMLAFLEIPCLSQRLEAALFQQSYKGRLQDIALKIRNLQVCSSPSGSMCPTLFGSTHADGLVMPLTQFPVGCPRLQTMRSRAVNS